jgi:hypothetical protein
MIEPIARAVATSHNCALPSRDGVTTRALSGLNLAWCKRCPVVQFLVQCAVARISDARAIRRSSHDELAIRTELHAANDVGVRVGDDERRCARASDKKKRAAFSRQRDSLLVGSERGGENGFV